MIEIKKIKGRKVIFAYLKKDMTPTTKEKAELIKMIDGKSVSFLVPEKDAKRSS